MERKRVEKSDEFAFLTNIIHEERTGLTLKKHKNLKGLNTQNLRDHISEAELIFTVLAELSTRQIAETEEANGLKQNANAGKKVGRISRDARVALKRKQENVLSHPKTSCLLQMRKSKLIKNKKRRD